MPYIPPTPPTRPGPQLPSLAPSAPSHPSDPAVHASATAVSRSWIALENRFYERATLAASCLRTRDCLVAAAAHAGPVALIADGGWGGLTVLDAAGREVGAWSRLRSVLARVVAVGWGKGDVVVVVYEDGGVVRVVDGRVEEEEVREVAERFVDACVVGAGIVVARSESGAVYCSGEEGMTWLSEGLLVGVLGREGGMREGMIVATVVGSAEDVEVLVIGEGGRLARVSKVSVVEVEGGDVHALVALSSDGKYAAAALASGEVVVRNMSTLAEVVRVSFAEEWGLVDEVGMARVPDTVAWVGPDAVAVAFGMRLLLIGPGGGVVEIELEAKDDGGGGSLLLQTESDGLRVVSGSAYEFVRMVPETVEAVFLRPDSPTNKLVRAAKVMEGTNHDAAGDGPSLSPIRRYELLTELRESGSLSAAAKGCVAAAYLVWDVVEQKALLSAAAYGQRFSIALKDVSALELSEEKRPPAAAAASTPGGRARGYPGRRAREEGESLDAGVPLAIATLRVLTTVRTSQVAIPMTKVHLDAMSFDGLIARISRYRLHDVATRLAAFCGLSPNVCLLGWARDQFAVADSDDEVARHIIAHFEETRRAFFAGGVRVEHTPPPYMLTAHDAFRFGRPRLAEYLLLRETNYAVKVSLYLEMDRESLALRAAILSKDNELVMDVVDQLRQERSVKELAQLFRSLPPAMTHRVTDMMVVYLREMGEAGEVQTLLCEVGRFREAALQAVEGANLVADCGERLSALEKTASQLSRWRHRKSNTFELQSLQQAIASSRLAVDLEKRNEISAGSLQKDSSSRLLSVAACIRDPSKRRDALSRVRRDLKIPESRFFWVVLEALAEAGAMDAVEALSTSAGLGRPPPIGLMPFVDVCLRHKQEGEAMKYALRIADLRDRARALARCGAGKEAADIASKLRNSQLMEEVTALVARHSSGITLPQVSNPSPRSLLKATR